MNYTIDYGNGWKNVFPDGYGMHEEPCHGTDCDGCWSPETGDVAVWFEAVEEAGTAVRARVGDEVRVFDIAAFLEPYFNDLGATAEEVDALKEILHVEGFGGREDKVETETEARKLAEERLMWFRETRVEKP